MRTLLYIELTSILLRSGLVSRQADHDEEHDSRFGRVTAISGQFRSTALLGVLGSLEQLASHTQVYNYGSVTVSPCQNWACRVFAGSFCFRKGTNTSCQLCSSNLQVLQEAFTDKKPSLPISFFLTLSRDNLTNK